MDAEIWSTADINNGRRLMLLLITLIVAKESAIIAGLAMGLVAPGTTLPSSALPFIAPEALRAAFAFAFSVMLVVFTYNGHSWARLSLGLIYLFISGQAGLNAVRAADAFQTDASKMALANAALGVLIGLTMMLAPTLRAFSWSQANRRQTIPVPLDDQPARRSMRRERTLGEALFAFLGAVGNLLIVLIVLGLGALLYGFGGAILRWLQP